jgi:hypothetical protein
MNRNDEEQPELTQEVHLVPGLATAISAWYAARHRFQIEPKQQHQDVYDAATNELGLAFSERSAERPELFEQLRFWFAAYPEE